MTDWLCYDCWDEMSPLSLWETTTTMLRTVPVVPGG
jgi:hypothetical protein